MTSRSRGDAPRTESPASPAWLVAGGQPRARAGIERANGRARIAQNAAYLGLLAVAHFAIDAAAHAQGLRALSDDDYARAVIAQSFAAAPRWDPSGTSWLPAPFWLAGTAMRLFGPSLEVARAAASMSAVASAWLLYAGGRIFGLRPAWSFAAALAAIALSPAAVLGSVAVPELPTAALCAFALLAARPSADRPISARGRLAAAWAAAAALLFACLSRYEAWPIAATAALALGFARPFAFGPCALCLVGPALWIVHNRVAHGDAFHFLARVAGYRAALGVRETPVGAALPYVRGLLVGCPEALALLALAIALAALRAGKRGRLSWSAEQAGRRAGVGSELAAWLANWRVPLAGLAALFTFLAIGAALGGAPTHHPERALLLFWLFAPVIAADRAARFFSDRERPRSAADERPSRPWLAGLFEPIVGLALVAVAVAALAARARDVFAGAGVDRGSEESAGRALDRLAGRAERALIATDDYGYFAVQAAFARPGEAVVDRTHDPRVPQETTSLRDPDTLRRAMAAAGARWLVAPVDKGDRLAADAGLLRVATAGPFGIWRAR